MRVLLLDADMAVDAASAEFSSNHSLYDYDMVIWDPIRSLRQYLKRGSGAGSYDGLNRLSDDASAQIKRDQRRRQAEFAEFVRLGRTLAVFLPVELTVYVATGEKTYSGVGKNQRTTTLVTELDLIATLPLQLTQQFVTGTEMEPCHSSIGPLYRQTADYWAYTCTIDSPSHQLQPLLRVKGTLMTVAAQYVSNEGGRIVLLPSLLTGPIDDDEDEDEDDEDGDDEDQLDSREVDPTDDNDEDREPNQVERLDDSDTETLGPAEVDQLVLQWLLAFSNSEEIKWPSWIDDYMFQSEIDRAPEIAAKESAAAVLHQELDDLRSQQAADRDWKLLVAGTGTPLEAAVADALAQLGFVLEPTAPGRTDVRGTHGARHVVVETKGVTKSAAESHSAQLEKWVAEDLEAGRRSKAILVINAWLQEPPQERTKPAFPAQMIPYAKSRNHCLITGIQLLNLVRTALAQPERAEEFANLLLTTDGVLEGWDDSSRVFAELPAPTPKRQRRSRTGRGDGGATR